MTGTANEFYDFNESNKLDLFSAWLFGRINANCLLSDISACGCSILLPKKQSAPSDDFKLLIMCPDDGDRLHTVLDAEKRWEQDHSLRYKKLGIKFRNTNPEQLQDIKVLVKHFSMPGRSSIKCSLLKR